MKIYIKFEILLIAFLFSIQSLIDCTKLVDKSNVRPEVEVWLTVSSLAGFDKKLNKQFERQLELNWKQVFSEGADQWIGLFGEEPNDIKLHKKGRNYSIESFTIENQWSGRHRTSVQFPYKRFSKKNLHLNCLKYWIALIDSNTIVAKNCLKINPFWIEKSLDTIGTKSLLDLMIPGTHNSGSFSRFDPKESSLMSKYSLCQDEGVFNQLVYGIRFLDLRVAYDSIEGQKNRLWIVHGPILMKQTLDSVLIQVKRFIEMAPKEVVVLDFHRFEKGFNKDEVSQQLIRRHHRKVLALILKHLKEYLVPKTMGLKSTINELIAKNKRIIIGYDSDHYLTDKSLVFPKTKHLWANTDTIEELIEYFNDTLCDSYPNQLFSAMAQLTAERFGIIIDRYNGLRSMAQSVNQLITESFSGGTGGWANCANVVASDYFLGNNLIDISIKTNLIRYK